MRALTPEEARHLELAAAPGPDVALPEDASRATLGLLVERGLVSYRATESCEWWHATPAGELALRIHRAAGVPRG